MRHEGDLGRVLPAARDVRERQGRALRIAVVGAGISGLSAAWLLGKRHDVTLYDAAPRAGGHANTVDIHGADGPRAVDTGFIVFNDRNYPELTALFAHLGVESRASDMSFAASLDGGRFEYAGSDLAGLLGQPRNILRPRFWRMLFDILRFYRAAPGLILRPETASMSLGTFLDRSGYSRAFARDHLLPMGAAIWSATAQEMRAYPLAAFLRFFERHGLLSMTDRPQWYTVAGGSRSYVDRILADFSGTLRLGTPVARIRRDPGAGTGPGGAAEGEVEIADSRGGILRFDHAVLACHADQALALLSDADSPERDALGAFGYTANTAVLHGDPALMPRRRRVWASWNYIGTGVPDSDARGAEAPDRDAPARDARGRDPQGPDALAPDALGPGHSAADRDPQGRVGAAAEQGLCVTYWMNRLQRLYGDDVFVTLNPPGPVAGEMARFDYSHPRFDHAALAAQAQLVALQGLRNTWFCGAHFGSGFHEDGLRSGLDVAEALGGLTRPWRVPGEEPQAVTPAAAAVPLRQAARGRLAPPPATAAS